MDGEFVNRTTLLMAFHALMSRSLPLAVNGKNHPVPPYMSTTSSWSKREGLSPVPGVFVSWYGVQQSVYEVLAPSPHTMYQTVPRGTTSAAMLHTLPTIFYVKCTENVSNSPYQRRHLGIVKPLSVTWDDSSYACNTVGTSTIRGTFDGIPRCEDQTLYVIASITVYAP
jgi:hypothetical protein